MATKLHITRVREAGTNNPKLDPNADIRVILPQAMRLVAHQMEDALSDSKFLKDIRYLESVLEIFELRLAEDPASLAVQMDAFMEALICIPHQLLFTWLLRLCELLAGVYSLYTRRDSCADSSSLSKFANAIQALPMPASISGTARAAVLDQIEKLVPEAAGSLLQGNGGSAVFLETGRRIDNVKQLARHFLSASGDLSWEALSEECDKGFGKTDDDTRNIVLALAYPDYRHPTLSVAAEKEDNDTGGED